MAKTVIIYSKNGEVKKIKSNAGETRHNKAAYELHRNNVDIFTRYKFARFFRRMRHKIKMQISAHRARRYTQETRISLAK
jgi:hypothetical protein